MLDDLVARLEGKSSLGRLGLLIHSTAGFVDAGFDGQLTLELSNVANLPITLYPNMKIGQISFQQMTTRPMPYGSAKLKSKYKHQQGPMPSRYWENFDWSRVTANQRYWVAVTMPPRIMPRPSSRMPLFVSQMEPT